MENTAALEMECGKTNGGRQVFGISGVNNSFGFRPSVLTISSVTAAFNAADVQIASPDTQTPVKSCNQKSILVFDEVVFCLPEYAHWT